MLFNAYLRAMLYPLIEAYLFIKKYQLKKMVINDVRVDKTTAAVLFFLLRVGNLVILILKFSIEC